MSRISLPAISAPHPIGIIGHYLGINGSFKMTPPTLLTRWSRDCIACFFLPLNPCMFQRPFIGRLGARGAARSTIFSCLKSRLLLSWRLIDPKSSLLTLAIEPCDARSARVEFNTLCTFLHYTCFSILAFTSDKQDASIVDWVRWAFFWPCTSNWFPSIASPVLERFRNHGSIISTPMAEDLSPERHIGIQEPPHIL